MRYAVILAGGAGRRLWPLSREGRPKQLLPLIAGKSLLQLSVERLEGMFPPANILVVTSAEYAEEVVRALPGLPRENIIGEPQGRDTANAVCLGALMVAKRDPQATMAVFTADHVIRPVEAFQQCIAAACAAAEERPQALVTFGIKPTWPHTGLGYIHRGQKLQNAVYQVRGFREKPDHFTARRYVDSGEYYWNSGMFVWKLQAILDALKTYLPRSLEALSAALAGAQPQEELEKIYPQLQKISIDFAVLEKAPNVLVVELSCEWLDVGNWPSLSQVSEIDEDGNTIVAPRTAMLDSERNVVVSEDDHLIAVLGMDDCIIVHSKDATLVCHKNESQRLKELVSLIQERYGNKHL